MAKLVLVALTFTALLALASAYTTTTFVTTTIQDQSSRGSSQQCSREIQGQRFNQCQRYLQQSIQGNTQQQQGLQSCCNELQNVDEMCQCEAVKQVFREVQGQIQQQQEGREGGSFGSQQIRQLKQKARNLPNQCNLQTRQCQVGNIITTTTTVVEEEVDSNTRGSQQCQHVQQQSFNQCQRYVERQLSGSTGTLLMSISRQGQQQEVEQCCRELKNVEEECQCEAMQQVYRQAERQQPSRRRGGQQQTSELKQVVERLRNQCDLEVQQCRIPSRMF